MATRTRTNVMPFTGKHINIQNGGSTIFHTCYPIDDSVIDDDGPGDCRPFTVNRYRVTGKGLVNGVSSGPGWNDQFIDRPCVQSLGSNANHVSIAGLPSDGALMAKLLAETNPSRPVVDLPVFVGELKDFPQLFKLVGENIFKTTAKANLAYHFGWRPLMQDLLGMMDFANVVKNRKAELDSLFKSGLRRTRNLHSGSASSTVSNNPIFNTRGTWFVNINRVTQLQVWGHCKWKPTVNAPSTNEEMRRLAIRAAYGLTIDPATAWELIPFSWLVDWCSSVGNFLSSQRNIVGATSYDQVIMKHYKTTLTCATVSTSPSSLTFTEPPSLTRETKLRTPTGASISAHLPFLSLRQLSILGSIALLGGASTRRRVYGI